MPTYAEAPRLCIIKAICSDAFMSSLYAFSDVSLSYFILSIILSRADFLSSRANFLVLASSYNFSVAVFSFSNSALVCIMLLRS